MAIFFPENSKISQFTLGKQKKNPNFVVKKKNCAKKTLFIMAEIG
jgi:hypothetical protein